MLEICCSPEGILALEGSPDSVAERRFATCWSQGPGAALSLLAAEWLQVPDLPPSWKWLRDLARLFFTRLCQTRDPLQTAISEEEVARHLAEAPPFPGSEHLSPETLHGLWQLLAGEISQGTAVHPDGLVGWLRDANPAWHLVGRVTFHLAENKTDSQRPFAFLATYTERLAASGKPQHLPLMKALQIYAGQKDQAALQSLLEPVRTAAERSGLIRDWLQSRRLFQPIALEPPEAWRFLQDTGAVQESGVIVKMPDWWKSGRPSRATVQIAIDAPKGVSLHAGALLNFKIQAAMNGETLTPEEWERLLSADTGLVSLRGQWVEVDREQLQSVLKHWQKAASAHSEGQVAFHDAMRWLSGWGNGLGSADGQDGVLAESLHRWSEVIAGMGLEKILQQMRDPEMARPPEALHATLRPYQLKGLAWLDFMSQLGFGACLADDMGLGKTLQVIAMLALRRERADSAKQKLPPVLLVLPASLVGNWMAEFRRFAPHLRVLAAHPSCMEREALQQLAQDPVHHFRDHEIMLTTYGFLHRNAAWQSFPWGVVILDEAQAIKNAGSGNAKAVKALSAPCRIALTGTPVENRPGDLWSLFDFLNPGLLGGARVFAEKVKACAAQPGGFGAIRKLTSPYILRRLKTDKSIINDLPDKTEMKAWCGLTKRQATLYAKLVEELSKLLKDPLIDGIQRRGLVLGFLMKFKQVCNHPSHWNGDGVWLGDDSGKFQRLAEICTTIHEKRERTLIFTQFQEVCDPLARFLSGVFGREGLILHGGTPVKKREGLVEEFQRPGGPPFFVISVKAGGTGLNLTAASHVIHFDRWWNPAVENQATDRAFRIGQKRNVLVHKFVCQGTIEERIDALIEEKKALATELLGSGRGGESLLMEMSNEALLDFVRLDISAAVG